MNEIEALKIKAHEEWATLSWEHPEERVAPLPNEKPRRVYKLTKFGEVVVYYFSSGIYVHYEPTNTAYRFGYDEREKAWAFARTRADHVKAIGALLGG
jgi:hypothetical protein